MTAEIRKFHYQFAHIGLRRIFFEDGEKLYDRVTKGNPDEEITRLWVTLGAQFQIKSSEKIRCNVFSLDRERDLLVVTLPDPEETPEAFYIGLVFVANRKFFKTIIKPERYFTLELGVNKEQRFIFCEWLQSNQHQNYGALSDSSIKTFVKAIKSSYSLANSGFNISSNISTGISSKISDINKHQPPSGNSNLDLDAIIDKWAGEFPDNLFDEAFEKVKTFEMQCNVLYNFIEVSDRLSRQKLKQLKEDIYNALVKASGRAMFIGAEFSIKDRNILESIRTIDDLPIKAVKLLEIAREEAVDINHELIKISSGYKPNAKEESLKVLTYLIEGQVQCYKLGALYINDKENAVSEREEFITDTDPLSQLFEKKMRSDIFPERYSSQSILDKWVSRIPGELRSQAILLMDGFRNECMNTFGQVKSRINLPSFVQNAYENVMKDVVIEISRNSLTLGVEYGETGICKSKQIENYADISTEAREILSNLGEPAFNFTFMIDHLSHKAGLQNEDAKAKYVNSLMDGQIECFKLGVEYGESLRTENSITPQQNDNKYKLSDTFKDLLDVAFHDPDPSVRQQAQDGLRELHPGGPDGFDRMICDLIEGLRDPEKRAWSLEVLPGHREMALPMLITYLKDPDPELRKLVTQIIVSIEKDRSRFK